MIIMPVSVESEIEAHEFDLLCDLRRDNPAVVSVKGCCDPAPALICERCFIGLKRFWINKMKTETVVCKGCHRPVLYFETHFDVIWLKGDGRG